MAKLFLRSTDGSDVDSGATWALAKATADGVEAVPWTNADILYVSDNHAETIATAITLAFPTTLGTPFRMVCSDDTADIDPPTATALTASFAVSGNASYNFTGFAYVFGCIFSSGSTAAQAGILVSSGATATGLVFESCQFRLTGANANPKIFLGPINSAGNVDDSVVELINCTVKFANAGQAIAPQYGRIRISGLAIDAAGTAPTTLFIPSAAQTLDVLVEASNLAGLVWTNLISISPAASGLVRFRNCKMPASWTATTGTNPGPGGVNVMIDGCDDADTNNTFLWSMGNLGTIIEELTIVKDSGANDGVAAISWEMTSSANVSLFFPLTSPKPIVIYNSTVGSAVTATVEVVNDGTTLTNAEIFGRFQFLGTSGFPQGSFDNDSRAADVLATAANQTASTVGWTTTGLASPIKQKLVHTFTPQERGFILCWPCLARASKTVFVDPKITLS